MSYLPPCVNQLFYAEGNPFSPIIRPEEYVRGVFVFILVYFPLFLKATLWSNSDKINLMGYLTNSITLSLVAHSGIFFFSV